MTTTPRRNRAALLLALLSPLIAAVASTYLLFGPIYTSSSGGQTEQHGFASGGVGPFMGFALVCAAFAIPAAAGRTRYFKPLALGAGMFAAFACFLAILSVGIFFTPSALLLLAAGAIAGNEESRSDWSQKPEAPA